jgi:hypothetical protein
MTNDLHKEAEAITKRMELSQSDMVGRRKAEQDMRAVALRYIVRAMCRAVAAGFTVVLSTPTYADRLRDPEHAAIR